MNIYLAGAIWVLGAAAVASAVAFAIRRFGEEEGREANNTAAGAVFTLVSGLHAVLMAFVLISLFDSVNTASADSYREANSLVAVSWAAESLPEPARRQIQQLTRDYANTVITQEWPRMRTGTDLDGEGWAELDELRLAIESAEVTTDFQQERKLEAANQLFEVYQARQDRVNAAGGAVSAVVWLALGIGSVLSMTLPYLFGGTRLAQHVLVTATLAATIALLLFAIYQLQNPFSGGAAVEPDAFRSALDRLG